LSSYYFVNPGGDADWVRGFRRRIREVGFDQPARRRPDRCPVYVREDSVIFLGKAGLVVAEYFQERMVIGACVFESVVDTLFFAQWLLDKVQKVGSRPVLSGIVALWVVYTLERPATGPDSMVSPSDTGR